MTEPYNIDSREYKRQLMKFLQNLQGQLENEGCDTGQLSSRYSVFRNLPDDTWTFETDIDFDLSRKEYSGRTENPLGEQLNRLARQNSVIRVFVKAVAVDGSLQKQDIQMLILRPADIDEDSGELSCPYCKTGIQEPLVVMRKVHFDFEINHPHQIAHIQYGGKCKARDAHYCVSESGLEIPRLFCLPVCIQSAIDYVANEFYFFSNKENDWNSMVIEGEKLFIDTALGKIPHHWNTNKKTLYHYYSDNFLVSE